MKSFKQISVWTAITAIGLAGPLVAAEYGGVLHWTHYVAALVILLLGVTATFLASTREYSTGLRQLAPLVPIILWVFYSWLQCVPLGPGTIASLSPGSHSAYVGWLEPILPEEELPNAFPISIAQDLSLHASSVLTLVLAFLCAILVVCRDRMHATWLLILLAAGISLHATYGMVDYLVAILNHRYGHAHEVGFGAYINQNNVAFLLNVGLACGLALIVSRLSAVSGLSGSTTQTPDWTSLGLLSTDRIVWVGIAALFACVSGLLTCGSRSGLIAVLMGGMVTYLWFRRRDGWLTIPAATAVACLVVLLSTLLLAPFADSLASIDQFSEVDLRSESSLLGDPRFEHWPDGFRAALHYLPAGSGIATYSYAYLPFQHAAPEGWFHHADNLWLELFVEQGMVGILLLFAVIGVVIRALLRLSHSTDSIDCGLQAACAYFIGCTAWSATFDFGLIILGNLLSVATLLGIVIARSQAVSTPVSNQPAAQGGRSSVRFTDTRNRIASLLLYSAITAAVGLCLPTLRRDAIDEYVVRTVKSELATQSSSQASLQKHLSMVGQAVEDSSDPDLHDLESHLNRKLARLKLVAARNPSDVDELNRALQETKADRLRESWRIDPDGIGVLPAEYSHAVDSAQRSLRRLPLGIVAREHIITLDFAHKNRQQSLVALEQLARLQKGSADRSVTLARLASAGGDETVAARLWKHATAIDPGKTKQALQHALADTTRDITLYVADQPICQRYVSGYLLDHPANDPSTRKQSASFLTRSFEFLNCEACNRNDERSRCEEVTGGILLLKGDTAAALEHFREAMLRAPADIKKRRRIIQRLIEAGLQQNAFELASESYSRFPDHFPFKVIADGLASEAVYPQENPEE